MFEKKWTSTKSNKQYEVKYCELCEVFSIVCNSCKNGSCNGSSCEICNEDFDLFHQNLSDFHWNKVLTEEEYKVFEKISYLKQFIPLFLERGCKKLNLNELDKMGHLSEHSRELFASELVNVNGV